MPRTLVDQLWQGESDQPPQTMLSGQVPSAVNCRLDVTVAGPTRRGPTRLQADLAALTASKDYYQIQIRDAIVFVHQDEIKAYRVTDGTELTVIDATTIGDFNQYLRTGTTNPLNPNEDLVSTVSVDTAVIANRNITIDTLAAWTYQQMLNYIESGDPDATPVTIFDEPTGNTVSKFSDLPGNPDEGVVYHVTIDENLDPHGTYVYFSGTQSDTYPAGFFPNHDGWYRIPKSGQDEARFDNATMPHIIVYDDEADTVTFAEGPWRHRISGNTGSNRVTNIVGTEVQDIFFLQGRLGFITMAHLVASRSGDFYNYWLNNVGTVDNEDRIDRELLTFKNLGRPLRVLVLGHSLVIGFELGQVAFTSGAEALTGINGQLRMLTKFATQDVPPGDSGDVGFLIDQRGYVHQYGLYESGGISAPAYLGWANIHRFRLTRGDTVLRLFGIERSMFITTESGSVLVHDTFGQGGQVVQSAWSQMTCWENPVFFAAWNDRIYIVTHDPTEGYAIVDYKHYDEEAPSGMAWAPTLDRLELVAGVYDENNDETTFEHTGRDGDIDSSVVVATTAGSEHLIPAVKRIEPGGEVVVAGGSGEEGDWDAASTGVYHYIGFAFEAEAELNEFWPNLDETVINVNKLTVHHFESSDYEVVIPAEDGDDRVHEFAARQLPLTTGVPGLHTGYFKADSTFDGRRTRVRIRSSSPGRFTIVAVAYEFGKPQGND